MKCMTVAICTWNRAKLLDQTLTQMHELRIPSGVEWELLVVNNDCTDDTDTVIERHKQSLPIRRLFEAKPGHSHARNCAVGNARGELIVWTDDDVLVDPGWLAAYVSAAQRWPDAAYMGGFIEPWYQCRPPLWVKANLTRLQGMLVIRDLGPTERPFVGYETPWGASMAFRTEILRRYPFDANLGLRKKETIRGDETALVDTLKAEGIQGVWVPSARAKHFIPASRVSTDYLWDYFFGYGQTVSRTDPEPHEGKTWFGAPRWMYRRIVVLWLRSAWNRLHRRTSWVLPYTEAAITAGKIREARSSSQGRREMHV